MAKSEEVEKAAKDTAKDVVDNVKDTAKNAADNAKDAVEDVKKAAKDKAEDIQEDFNELKREAQKRAEDAKKEAVKQINKVAETMRKEIRDNGGSDEALKWVDGLAGNLEKTAGYLNKSSLDDIGEDATRVVSNNPWQTAFVAMIIGLILGRLFKR
jgi:ElaB/YqjD/DUF883 family membrane-anchored ribosome-binding protein